MPRRLFKKLNRQRHRLRSRWFMRPFEFTFGDAGYWSLHRRNVTRAVALGFLIAFVPPPIPHSLLAVLIAVIFRVNIPVTFAATFITNPFTMLPLFYAAYRSGCFVLGLEPLTSLPTGKQFWYTWFHGPFLEPFLLGCLLLGLLAATVGYIALGLFWHLSLVNKFFQRKRLRRLKEQNNSSDKTPP